MGVLSNKIERENLKPGDHIYSWRRAYIYAHHGIYVGEGNVIHFTTRGSGRENGTRTRSTMSSSSSSSSSYHPMGSPCASGCGDQSKLDGVICSCIDCFLLGGNLYLFEYGVTPVFFLAQFRGGTCTRASSDPPEVVIHRAKYLLQNGCFGSYDIFKNNCENFAIYCKTGLHGSIGIGQSGQAASFQAAADAFKSIASDVVYSPQRYLTPSSIGGAVVRYGVEYCFNRLESDIGGRSDVRKVAVESLVAPFGSNESEVVTEMYKGG